MSVINSRMFLAIIISNIYSAPFSLSSPSGIPIIDVMSFENFPQFLDVVYCVCVIFFSLFFFFFCISVWEVSISLSSSSPILSSTMSNVLMSFLNFYYNILDFYHFLLGFSQNLNHSAYFTHLFSMLSTFPIRALRLL